MLTLQLMPSVQKDQALGSAELAQAGARSVRRQWMLGVPAEVAGEGLEGVLAQEPGVEPVQNRETGEAL